MYTAQTAYSWWVKLASYDNKLIEYYKCATKMTSPVNEIKNNVGPQENIVTFGIAMTLASSCYAIFVNHTVTR